MAGKKRCRLFHRWREYHRMFSMNEYRSCTRCGAEQIRVTPWSGWRTNFYEGMA